MHYWFVIRRAEDVDRWEVWQTPDHGGQSYGHLHRNLLPPDSGVGWGGSWLVASWSSENAEQLIGAIESTPAEYPWRRRYRYWPGPNSNSYVQWVLGNRHRLDWRAIGRGYGTRRASGPL